MANPYNLKGVKKPRTLLAEDEAENLLQADSRNKEKQRSSQLAEPVQPRMVESTPPRGAKRRSQSAKEDSLAKTRDPQYIMTTIYIPKDLHIEIKRALLEIPGKDISDLVAEFILEGLIKAGVKLKNEKPLRQLIESKHKKD